MPDQAGKLSSERNGGYTRLKGPFHPAEGLGMGVNCPLSGPPGLRSNLGGEAVSARGSSLAVLCVHNTAENDLRIVFNFE